MSTTFTVFPRESLLFGLALGQYLRLHELGQAHLFEYALYCRVHPFVPDLTRIIERQVGESDVPKGIKWSPSWRPDHVALGDIEFGYVPANAVDFAAIAIDPLLRRRGGKPFRIEYDRSRRSGLDLLIEYLTEGTRRAFNDDEAVRERLHLSPPRLLQEKSPEEITHLMQILILDNKLEKTFAVGKLLGRAFGDCVAVEKYLLHMEERFFGVENPTLSDEQFENVLSTISSMPQGQRDGEPDLYSALEASWSNLVSNLRSDPVFQSCLHDENAFLTQVPSGKSMYRGRYFGFSDLDEHFDSVLNAMFCIRGNLCLILGAIYGRLHDQDNEAIDLDSKRSTPRDFRSTRDSGMLHLAEQALNEGNTLPEEIIRGLSSNIEKWARQLWPNALRGTTVAKLLRDHLSQGTQLERRFAHLALGPYIAYRNPSVHESNTFRCAAYDARQYLVTMQTLDKLVNDIEKEREQR